MNRGRINLRSDMIVLLSCVVQYRFGQLHRIQYCLLVLQAMIASRNFEGAFSKKKKIIRLDTYRIGTDFIKTHIEKNVKSLS